MDPNVVEKFSGLFAKCAAAGDVNGLRKEAADHALIKTALTPAQLLMPAGAAGLGGLLGYYGTDKDKDRWRNALYGALTGGVTGAGAQMAAPLITSLLSGKVPSITTPAAGGGAFNVADKPAAGAPSATADAAPAAPASAPASAPSSAPPAAAAETKKPDAPTSTPAPEGSGSAAATSIPGQQAGETPAEAVNRFGNAGVKGLTAAGVVRNRMNNRELQSLGYTQEGYGDELRRFLATKPGKSKGGDPFKAVRDPLKDFFGDKRTNYTPAPAAPTLATPKTAPTAPVTPTPLEPKIPPIGPEPPLTLAQQLGLEPKPDMPFPGNKPATSAAEFDKLQAQYERDMAEWRRGETARQSANAQQAQQHSQKVDAHKALVDQINAENATIPERNNAARLRHERATVRQLSDAERLARIRETGSLGATTAERRQAVNTLARRLNIPEEAAKLLLQREGGPLHEHRMNRPAFGSTRDATGAIVPPTRGSALRSSLARNVPALGAGTALTAASLYANQNTENAVREYMNKNPNAGIGKMLYDAIGGTAYDLIGRRLEQNAQRTGNSGIDGFSPY